MDRRAFVTTGIAAGTALALGKSPLAFTTRKPDEIRVAVAGIRSRGWAHVQGLNRLEGVRVVALCDVDRGILENRQRELAEQGTETQIFRDFRDVLTRDDIDVVSIATPNHWHAMQTVWACAAGKDVYVEKPVSHNVREGRLMVEAAKRHGRIVQAGTQSRSSSAIREAIAWMHEGHIGKPLLARGLCYKPRTSIGKVDGPRDIPKGVDYDLWTGPAPMKPLRRRQLHYDWHWDFDTGNGDLGNQGIHQMDLCRWAMGYDRMPDRVIGYGGRFGYDDDGNTPNTLVSILDYPEAPIIFEVRGLPSSLAAQKNNWGGSMDRYLGMSIGAAVHCEEGTLLMPNYSSARVIDRAGSTIKEWRGAQNHFQNFIDAVRSRDTSALNGSIEDGHLSSALCHLGNISYLRGETVSPKQAASKITWPTTSAADVERVVGHLRANGIDFASSGIVAGKLLEMDKDSESFIGDADANVMLFRPGRAEYVFPDEA
ncbi:MAG: Gfo/Idh/MocA family oxidoreductase [Planctomycetota bacterium]